MATKPTLSRECSVQGCSKALEKNGYCGMHNRRVSRHGDPSIVHRVRHQGTPSERFWAKIDADGPCWEWGGHRKPNGYGMYSFDGRMQYVHRIAWQLLVGSIPRGLELDHLCRNRKCVNPDHLEPVTRAENIRRGIGPALLRSYNLQRSGRGN